MFFRAHHLLALRPDSLTVSACCAALDARLTAEVLKKLIEA
jgi:hypothetical protein